ncbi:MAG: squalene/phytoene synthase family protein [Pseudomonadota bacterium]
MSSDLDACVERVRAGDPDRFLATMSAPPALRAVLFPLYAFNVEVSRAPWMTSEAMIAEMRLQWWRDVLEEISSGGPVRRHEIATPLADVLDADMAQALDRSVEARRWDIYREPFETPDDFDAHIADTAGTLLWVAGRLSGAGDDPALRSIGWAQGLANWLLAIPALEAAGRMPLVDGRAEAIADLAKRGLAALSARPANKAGRIAALAAWRARPLLKLAIRAPQRVAAGDLAQSEFARRGGLLMQSLRA